MIAEVDQEELRRAVFNLPLRLEMIMENEGGTIEQLLKNFWKRWLIFALNILMFLKIYIFKTYMTFGYTVANIQEIKIKWEIEVIDYGTTNT